MSFHQKIVGILIAAALNGCVPSQISEPNDIIAEKKGGDETVFFSPKGGCQQEILRFIQQAKTTLDVAMYSFTDKEMIRALKDAKNRGVQVRLLLDRLQATSNKEATLQIRAEKLNVRVHSVNKLQHNKFAVADGMKVVTGSFNWTNAAELSNEENCVFLNARTLVEAFQNRFNNHLWLVNTEEKSLEFFKNLESKK